MIKEEWNLSEKIQYGYREERNGHTNNLIKSDNFESIDVDYVKEFIKRLKEEIPNVPMLDGKNNFTHDKIDKLAGERLR